MIEDKVIFTVILIVAVIITQEWFIRSQVGDLFNKTAEAYDDLVKYVGEDNEKYSCFADRLNNHRLLKKLKDGRKVELINRAIVYFELVFIAFVAFITFEKYHHNLYESMGAILTVVAGWMAIKVVGNYSQWADPVIGRAYYYVFLIGSIMNIGLALFASYVLSIVI